MALLQEQIDQILADLELLSEREGRLDFQLLMNDRNKFGFRHKIMDLKGKTASGQGWTLSNDGLLVVQPVHNSDELMSMLERDDMLGRKDWFQKRAFKAAAIQKGELFGEPTLPNNYKYTEQFKTLGYWGENPAMDVIKFIAQADGSLGVRVIKRTDTLKWAFVGGMIDKTTGETNEKVLQTCFKETLEELYSKKLFEDNSRSAKAAAKEKPAVFAALFDKVFGVKAGEKDEFEDLKSKGIVTKLQPLFNNSTADFNTRIQAMKKAVLDGCKAANMSAFDTEVAWVRIKCRLYEALWPAKHEQLNKFLRDNFVALGHTVVEADNRNTNQAWMTTRPHYIMIDHKVMDNLEKELDLDAAGGDDALVAKILPLQELFQEAMFASHGKILLQALTNLVSNNPDLLENPKIIEQIKAVKTNIEKREMEMYGAVQTNLAVTPGQNSGLVLRARNPKPVISAYLTGSSSAAPAAKPEDLVLPVAASAGQVEQLNVLQAAIAPNAQQFEVIDEASQAYDSLMTKVGPEALARIARDMERYGLGQNIYMVMDELNGFYSVNILIDDSGSMQAAYQYTDSNGAKQSHSRWNEAQARLNVLIPLLANAGVRVSIRALNNTISPSGLNFDFTRPNNMDSATYAQQLERKTTDALAEINQVFTKAPLDHTYVINPLNAFFKQTPQGQRSMTFFLTDGVPNEPTNTVINTCLNARNKEANPVTFIACTNDTQAVSWLVDHSYQVDQAGKYNAVQVLMDYPNELERLKAAQGDKLPYSRDMYLMHHLVPPSTEPQNLGGLHVLQLASSGQKLSTAQVSQWTGLTMDPSYYQLYEAGYNQVQAQRKGVVSTMMSSGGYTGNTNNNNNNNSNNTTANAQKRSWV